MAGLRRAANPNLQRVHIPHQAHAVAHAPLHFGDVFLLAPIKHIESSIRQVVEAGVHFRIVVVDLHPVFWECVADTSGRDGRTPGNAPR